MKKKIISIVACIVGMMLGITGCGNKVENGGAESDYKNHVYRMQDISQPGDDVGINQILKAGDDLYVTGYNWKEDGTGAYMLFFKIAEDGSFETEYRMELEVNSNLSYMTMDKDANIYCINNVYGPREGTDEYVDTYFLEKRTLEGEVLFSVNVNEVPQIAELSDEYLWISNMIMLPEKGLYLNVMGSLAKFDLEGNFEKIITAANQDSQSALDAASMIKLADDRVVSMIYDEAGMKIALVDLETGAVLGEKYKLPGNSYDFSLYAGLGYDLYLVSGEGVFGYNVGDTDKTMLMSYIDSDCGFYNVFNLIPLTETEFIAMYNAMDYSNMMIARFTKVPPDEVVDKQVITLACTGTDYEITRAVVKFNKENEKYRISVLNYGSMYSTEEDYNAGVNRLNTDIVSGKVPDMVLLDSRMPVNSYISKGLFEDLKPYIEKDEEMSLSDFMPNIIEAYSVNGKLYRLVPSFSIQTLVAKSADVGKERGWTVQEAMDIWASKPEGTEFVTSTTRDNMLWYCMSMSGGQFMNNDTGKCSFNSDEFIKLLEFLSLFPEEIDAYTFDDEYWMNYESMWREGKVLTTMTSIGDFRNYNYIEKGTFGEDITIIGYPSGNGSGSSIMANREFAMSSKSKHKDGVWEFLRVFLLEEYQSSDENWGFPISIKCLDEMGQEATKRPSYTDEYGNVVEYDDYYYMNNMEIIIEPMTEQEVEELKENLYSFTEVYSMDESLINIIKEESAAYFNGQKQAKDVADVIQSRAQIYVNETR